MSAKHKMPVDASEWRAKLQEHPLEIEGALIRLRTKAWINGNNAEFTHDLSGFARLWGVHEDSAKKIIEYLDKETLVSVSLTGASDSACNQRYTLTVTMSCNRPTEELSPEEAERRRKNREKVREWRARNR